MKRAAEQSVTESKATRLLLASLSLGCITVALDASILVVSMPRLGEVFGADPGAISWVNIVYLLASQSLMLTLAGLGDFAGKKRVYLAGLGLYTVGLALCAASNSLGMLLAGRTIQGIGAATTYPLSIAIAVDAIPAKQQGKALGVLTSATSIGLIAGPVVGGLLPQLGGWQAIFWTRIPIALLALGMGAYFFTEQRSATRKFRIDTWGSLTLIGLACSFLLFLSFGGRFGLQNRYSMLFGALTLVLLPVFLRIERTAAYPVLDLGLFRRRRHFSLSTASAVLQPACTSMAIFLTPFYLVEGLGNSAAAVGMYMAAIAVPSVFLAPLSGRLADQYGSRMLAGAGMIVACLALLYLSRLGQRPDGLAIGFGLALVGTAIGIFLPANNSAVMGSVPKGSLGSGSAVLSMARQIGSSGGIAISSAVFSARKVQHLDQLLAQGTMPSAARTSAAVAGFSDTMILACIIGALAVLTAFMRGSN